MMKAIDVIVALCDGHGLETYGKETPIIPALGRRIKENEFNRAVVKLLDQELIRCGFKTLLVAPTDLDTPLSDRVRLANNQIKNKYNRKVDLYVSVHYNALDGKFDGAGIDPEGFSVHVYPNSPESKKVADFIIKELVAGTPQKNRGVIVSNFQVLRETTMPAILSENGFMDNQREASFMLMPSFQKEVAVEHAKAICKYFGVAYVEEVKEAVKLTKFKDVAAGAWYEKSIKVASELGIMNGDTEGNFNPSKPLTRAEMAVIIAKLHEKGLI